MAADVFVATVPATERTKPTEEHIVGKLLTSMTTAGQKCTVERARNLTKSACGGADGQRQS
jgi:hypothetical protein